MKISLDDIWKIVKEKGVSYIVTTVAKASGLKAWLLTQVLSKFFETVVKPVVDWLERKGILWKKKIEIKKAVEDLENAKTPSDIDSGIDRLP